MTLSGAVSSVAEALKNQPSTFAMIIISFGLLGFTFYEGMSFNNQRLEMTRQIFAFQEKMNDLLARCVVAETSQFGRDLQIGKNVHELEDLRKAIDELRQQQKR